ncbi:MAG TPA: S4 domain-containing protein [Steroidobacteraceae bacterium]|jgi:23S rRNA pseudouridine2605 synthase|nr:S4 domain-containing protein [Steroidobacteraceae bacterium]
MSDAAGQRLQKALAHLGLASRREVETWIRAGRLTVNGQPATLGMRVVAADKVRLDGRLVRQRVSSAIKVFVVHRSPGVEMRELVQQLPRSGGRRFVAVSPMPAIDGGLELVSSDGETAERLQRGVRHLVADFSVRVHGELSQEGVARVLQGKLDNGTTVIVHSCDAAGGEGSNRWYNLVALGASGKDIRQLFERQGAMVSRVLRTRLGTVTLDRSLARGRSRLLDDEEAATLMTALSGTADTEPAAP